MEQKEKKNKSLVTLVSMEDCILTLNRNAESSLRYLQYGNDLIKQADHRKMDEQFAREMQLYITQCSSQIKTMHELRRPITDALTSIHKKFTSQENAINPEQVGSPAYACGRLIDDYLKNRIMENEKTKERLNKNLTQSIKRIERRGDLNDAEKAAAKARAQQRHLIGERELSLKSVETELSPLVKAPDGYLALVSFWWVTYGKGLPQDKLDNIFRVFIRFAADQAKKGVFCKNGDVAYVNVPKRKIMIG